MDTGYISIPEFYSGKNVLITGGTGFVGKVIIEKLLRSCPEVQGIFLLVRPKKSKNVNERINELLNSSIFDNLRTNQPELLKKVIPLESDIGLKELGLSEENQKFIVEKISIVFHSAATIKFDEPLAVAIKMNLQALKELLSLCRKMEKLEALVHLSTAYTNWFELDVKEQFYPTNLDPDEIMKLPDILSTDILNDITPKLLGKHANTYTFTKALGEKFIEKECLGLPVAIVRPSIVISCHKEPIEGWIDNFSGSTIFVYAIANGLMHSFHTLREVIIDAIPVDMTANLIIAAGWKTAMAKSTSVPPKIYNCTSSAENPITMTDFFDCCSEIALKYPLETLFSYPWFNTIESKLGFEMKTAISQLVPSYAIDFIAKLCGNKSNLVKTQKKIDERHEEASFVRTNKIIFQAENKYEIMNAMNQKDKEMFPFDVRIIDWKEYLDKYIYGIRTYLLKQNPETILECKEKLQKLKYLHYFMITSSVALLVFGLKKCQKSLKKSKL